MGGVDFDGSPISETDEEPERGPGHVIKYREIWDHEVIPLEHEIIDQSELPPGYRFASGLSREELRSRYQFSGNGVIVDSADIAGAYTHSSVEAELARERYCAVLADRTQAPPLSESDDEEEAAIPTRLETWPNGSPMWATAPGNRIQLRMLPILDRNRAFASHAGSPGEMPDAPSVAQLRVLWENQFPGIEPSGNNVLFSPTAMRDTYGTRPEQIMQYAHRVESGVPPERVMRYVDDDPPLRNRRPPFVDRSDDEANGDPGTSESPTYSVLCG